ncbi:DUF4386 domain-containing protein [Spirosoma sp. SC4-14]|uniref:DUF4386 domain-containing protein n=1 Tax=Spirosoma sp. SC4-14 TaxID=3128900 RepID=UPI0030D04F37
MQPTLDVSTEAVRYGRFVTKQWLVGLLITELITVLAPVSVLSARFHFPDILREPASVALPLFAANQSVIVPAYYVFMLSGLLYLPMSILLRRQLSASATQTAGNLLVGLGVATALFQTIGFSRWLFAVPYLADAYEQATANPTLRDSISLLYDTLNRYAGMTIGEHLGFLAMGGWTICLALMLPRPNRFARWFSASGILIGGLIMVSIAEHFGTAQAGLFGLLNFIANTLWSVWMLVLAVQHGRQ